VGKVLFIPRFAATRQIVTHSVQSCSAYIQNTFEVLPRPQTYFVEPAKSGLYFFSRSAYVAVCFLHHDRMKRLRSYQVKRTGIGSMDVKKTATIIQIAIVSLLIIYGTVNLFLGHFEGAFVTFPFLLFYYVYIVARQRREKRPEDGDDSERN
jgi:hypothetical protein